MAVIKSGATTDTLTVDPTSKAARVTLYDVAGVSINPAYTIYQVAVNVQPTTLSTGTTYWTMRNTASGGGKSVYLRGASLTLSEFFTNTSTVASIAGGRSLFDLVRFSAATPTAGTALTVMKRRSADGTASVVTDVRFAPGGLTTTSVSFEASPFTYLSITTQGVGFAPATNNNPSSASWFNQPLDFTGGGEEGRVILGPGEGLAIRANGTILANTAILGTIWWDER